MIEKLNKTFFWVYIATFISLVIVLVMPSSFCFKYYDVRPLTTENEVGEPITFISDSEFKRSGSVVWNDNIKCEPVNNRSFESYYESSDPAQKKRERKESDWVYFAPTPDSPSSCILETTITFYAFGVIPKRQYLISEPFIFE